MGFENVQKLFFLFPDLCPFPPPESLHRPPPLLPWELKAAGAGVGGGDCIHPRPHPTPGPPGFGGPGLRAPIAAGRGGGAPHGGSRGGWRLAGPPGAPALRPEDGAGTSAEHPSWLQTTAAPPAARPETIVPWKFSPLSWILIKVLCRSAHFQPISHEEACWCRWCMESSAPSCLGAGPLEP